MTEKVLRKIIKYSKMYAYRDVTRSKAEGDIIRD
jgi:hypothetical protein